MKKPVWNITSWTDRHGVRRHAFRFRGKKYMLPGQPGTVEYETKKLGYITDAADGKLGRMGVVQFMPGSIGAVIANYKTSQGGRAIRGLLALGQSTRDNYEIFLRMIEAELGPFPMRQLTPTNVRAFRDKLKDRGEKPSMIDACLSLLSTLWAFGGEHCKLPLGANPVAEVEKLHTTKTTEPWPEWVIKAFYLAGDYISRLALALLLYTGQRESDVINMEWSHIRKDPETGRDEILVRQQKTGTPVWIPLFAPLKELLDKVPKEQQVGIILLSEHGRKFATVKSLYRRIKAGLRRIDEAAGNNKRNISAFSFKPHGLRATAAVMLSEAGLPDELVAAITGHKDIETLRKHYLAGVKQRKRARQVADFIEANPHALIQFDDAATAKKVWHSPAKT